MNGKMIGRKPLYVAVAQRKEERKARLQVRFFFFLGNAHIILSCFPLMIFLTQMTYIDYFVMLYLDVILNP